MATRIAIKKVDQEQLATFEYKISRYKPDELEGLRKWYAKEPEAGMSAYDRQNYLDKREYLRVEIGRRELKSKRRTTR